MNRNKTMIALVVGVAIVAIAGFMILQRGSIHQQNMLTIEKCFENFENESTVVIEKKNFWSPVTCVKQ